ncbi:MAG: YtxH domain-containing protein [Chloroflexi bacterium]|nr:YtxH domain-containing protein [Chloroflexota bacterium]
MRTMSNFILGALLGGLVGATLALLLTPASGEQLRQQLRSSAVNFKNDITQAASDRRAELEKQLTTLRSSPTPKAE